MQQGCASAGAAPKPSAVRRDRWLLLAAVLGLTTPFLARPFHIDDDIYLKGAAQVLSTPGSPLGGTQKMLGEVMPTYHFTQHPPLVSYLIALVSVVTGDPSELVLHLVFLVFPLLAALACHELARRFTAHPLETALLLVATPAFLVSSHGIMTDLPFLAFALWAVVAFVRAVAGGARRDLALGGLCLTLASFTQYRGLLLVPFVVGYAWLQGKRRAPVLGATLPALLLVGLWTARNLRDLGVAHLADASSWIAFAPGRMLTDGVAYVALVGGVTLFPLFLLFVLRRSLGRIGPAAAVVALTAAALAFFARDYSLGQQALLVLVFATGAATIGSLAPSWPAVSGGLRALRGDASSEAARDELFLAAFAFVTLLSQVVLNLFASARSILLALPFLLILLVRRLQASAPTPAVARRTLLAGVALTVPCGLMVAVADYQFALAERDMARTLGTRLAGEGRVWFSAEWGFRHYMEREGLAYATLDGAGLVAGDLLVMPEVPCPADLLPSFVARLRLVDSLDSDRRFPIKVMSFEDRAGFYSNFHGLLPYAFSRRPLESARVFRVVPP